MPLISSSFSPIPAKISGPILVREESPDGTIIFDTDPSFWQEEIEEAEERALWRNPAYDGPMGIFDDYGGTDW